MNLRIDRKLTYALAISLGLLCNFAFADNVGFDLSTPACNPDFLANAQNQCKVQCRSAYVNSPHLNGTHTKIKSMNFKDCYYNCKQEATANCAN